MLVRLPVLAGLTLALTGVAGCNLFPEPDPLSKLEGPPRLTEPRTSYLDLGRQYLRAGEVAQAKAAFVRSMRVEGYTAAALTGAGLAAERQGLLTEARRFFERAKAKAPGSVLAHNNLGAVLYRMGEYHAAKQAFQAAFALSSGTSRVATHNLALSELAIRKALDDNPPEVPNPLPLQREGSGEYRILDPKKQESSS
ncbi:MAG: tetratricopeptide repeat protein [Pseudomonadota bacterium]